MDATSAKIRSSTRESASSTSSLQESKGEIRTKSLTPIKREEEHRRQEEKQKPVRVEDRQNEFEEQKREEEIRKRKSLEERKRLMQEREEMRKRIERRKEEERKKELESRRAESFEDRWRKQEMERRKQEEEELRREEIRKKRTELLWKEMGVSKNPSSVPVKSVLEKKIQRGKELQEIRQRQETDVVRGRENNKLDKLLANKRRKEEREKETFREMLQASEGSERKRSTTQMSAPTRTTSSVSAVSERPRSAQSVRTQATLVGPRRLILLQRQ